MTQHQARHARAQDGPPRPAPPPGQGGELAAARGTGAPQATGRKPAVARRTVLGLTAAAAAAGLSVAGWDRTHHTTASRNTPAGPRPQPGGTPLWTTTLTNSAAPIIQAVVGGIVYVGNGSKQYALRASDGAKLSILGSLAFDSSLGEGVVCAEGPDGLYAVRVADGHKLWHCQIQNLVATIVDGSVIYAATEYGVAHAVSAQTGRKIWSFPTLQGQPSGLAVANGVAYIGGTNPGSSIYAIHAGRVVWRRPIVPGLYQPMIAGERLYVDDGKLRALNIRNGTEVWSFPSDAQGFQVYDDVVFIADGDWTVHALSADDGRQLWQLKGGGTVDEQAPIVAKYGNTAYVQSESAVYALHAMDGTLLWRFNATIRGIPGIALAGDKVYLADNNLYALRAADGKELWKFPVEVSANPPWHAGVAIANDVVYLGSTNYRVYAVHI